MSGTWKTLAEKGKTQEVPVPFRVSGRKQAEHELFYHLPKTGRSPALFSALPYVAMHQGELFANPYPPGYSPRRAGFPETTPTLTAQLPSQSKPSLARVPSTSRGTDPSWVGAVGEQPPRSREKPEPAVQGQDFTLTRQPSTCKLRGLKCPLSGRVWQENEVKVPLLPNLSSTVVLEPLR